MPALALAATISAFACSRSSLPIGHRAVRDDPSGSGGASASAVASSDASSTVASTSASSTAGAGGADCVDPPDGGPLSWLDDPCLWTPVPELAECEVSWANLPSPVFPVRPVETCGDGCTVLPAPLVPEAGFAELWPGWSDGNTTYIRVLSSVREVLDVTHDVTRAAVQTRVTTMGQYADCTPEWGPLGPVDVETWIHGPSPYDIHYARVRYLESPALEVAPGATMSDNLLDTGPIVPGATTYGYLVAAGEALHIATEFGPEPYPAVSPGSDAKDVHAFGDTYVWHDVGGPPDQVHAWAPSFGYEVVVSPGKTLLASAIGSAGVLWIQASTPSPKLNPYDYSGLDLFRAVDPGAPVPELVVSHLLGDGADAPMGLVAGDDLAATTICREVVETNNLVPSDCPLVIAQLSTGNVWRLGPPTPTSYWGPPLIVDAHALVVGERIPKIKGYPLENDASRIFVLDPTKLDALAATFPYSAPGSP